MSCGEASGDLYAGELVRALRGLEPGLECFGLGGERLASAGGDLVAGLDDVSVIGLVEVIAKLPGLRRAMRALVRTASERRPDVAVLIDFSGFNLRLARKLKELDVPIVYYVSPQVWAWRPGRIATIRETVDRMIVILPFEEAFYRSEGVPVTYVGHPLVDLATAKESRSEFLSRRGLDPEKPVLALLPGSRRREIELHMPILAGALEMIRARLPDLQFLLLKAGTVERAPIVAGLGPMASEVRIIEGATHEGLTHAQAAIVASGTATVDAALCTTPMVVIYRVGRLSYVLGKPFVRVPYYAMVNLIASEKIVPELIQDEMNERSVAEAALELIENSSRAETMRRALEAVKARLGDGGASRRAAEIVLSLAAGDRATVGGAVG